MSAVPNAPVEIPGVASLQRNALIVSAVGAAVCVLGIILDAGQFFRSYLVAFLYVGGIGLGSLAILMIDHLAGGRWAVVMRRLMETAARTLPLIAILFIPLAIGLGYLYTWYGHSRGPTDPWKYVVYLTPTGFYIRAVIYFAIWIGFGMILNSWSQQQDQTGDPALTARLRMLSGPGLIVYALTITFAAVDWAMSLTPDWYSTIYGLIFGIGNILTCFTFMIAMVVLLSPYPPLNKYVTKQVLRDYGNLMRAFVMIWTYFQLSQFLLIWSANLKEEVPWYLDRMENGWDYIGTFLVVGHFVIPFLALLPLAWKLNPKPLACIALWLLFMRFVDVFWLITPSVQPTAYIIPGFPLPLRWLWLDLGAVAAVGGLWLAFFLWQMNRAPLIPLREPRIQENHHHA